MGKKNYVLILAHLLFCFFTVLFFRLNSSLRPAAFGALYKECIAGGIVLSVFYLNYFVLYPKLYSERRHTGYLTSVLAVLITATLSEEFLVFNQVYEIVKDIDMDLHHYFANQCVLIFFRDSCFFLFSFMLCTIRSLIRDKHDLHQYLHTQKHLIVAKDIQKKSTITVDIKDITHCQQIENYAYIYLQNGNRYTRNCTLSSLAEDIGPDYSVRISRNIIAMYAYIQSFDKNTVFIQTHEGVIGFNITNYYRETAFSQLMLHVVRRNVAEKNPPFEDLSPSLPEIKQDAESRFQIDAAQLDETQSTQIVLSFISEHPDCKGSDIADHLHVSLSTVNRILAQLKAEGLVEYVGSKKTGGYRTKATNNEP
ncbi:MAG: MarR family transcriptional regulator [Bacteroidales bacterium]|nr:MarR family transcriptional regulator [Bacteroidales bacterium]